MKLINHLLSLEEKIILDEIKKLEENEVCENLLLTNNYNVSYRVHNIFINSLIWIHLNKTKEKNLSDLKKCFTNFDYIDLEEQISDETIVDIPILIENLHITFLNSVFSYKNNVLTRSKSKHHLKENGAVYTFKNISNQIVGYTLKKHFETKSCKEHAFLDFSSGTGRFYFEAFDILVNEYLFSAEETIRYLFAYDIDEVAINILKSKVISKIDYITDGVLHSLKNNIKTTNLLIPDKSFIDENINRFDVVFSNPPYLLMKINRKKNDLNKYYDSLKGKFDWENNFFRKSGIYEHSIEGILNYYKISIEMIIKLSKPYGHIGIICPSSIFGDLSSKKIRRHLLEDNNILKIRYYPESSNLFENVSQSTVIFYIQKSIRTQHIQVEFEETNKFDISYENIKDIFNENLEIPIIDKIGWDILFKISKFKKIKDYPFIRNKRGEFDLTLNKKFITNTETDFLLVRGNMISNGNILHKKEEYVLPSFLDTKNKDFINDFNSKRLICQQISNIDLNKRLNFAFTQKNHIIGNSCNYLTSTRDSNDIDKIYHILNSKLLNWRFKVTSSNNHINNYEIDNLPMIDIDSLDVSESMDDVLICNLYGLNEEEQEYILKKK